MCPPSPQNSFFLCSKTILLSRTGPGSVRDFNILTFSSALFWVEFSLSSASVTKRWSSLISTLAKTTCWKNTFPKWREPTGSSSTLGIHTFNGLWIDDRVLSGILLISSHSINVYMTSGTPQCCQSSHDSSTCVVWGKWKWRKKKRASGQGPRSLWSKGRRPWTLDLGPSGELLPKQTKVQGPRSLCVRCPGSWSRFHLIWCKCKK